MSRIAIAGASGTGKTRLARYVNEKFGLEINPVGSRSVSKQMGFESPYDVDQAGKRKEFQHLLQSLKIEWEREKDAFITDRTTLDELTYTIMHDVKAVDSGYLERATKHLERYTHVVACPTGVFINTDADPQRVHDPTYQEIFDSVLVGLLTKYLPPSTKLVVMGFAKLETRFSVMDEIMREGSTLGERQR